MLLRSPYFVFLFFVPSIIGETAEIFVRAALWIKMDNQITLLRV